MWNLVEVPSRVGGSGTNRASLDVGPPNRAELLLAGPLAVRPAGESSRAGTLP
jgi:hypothetical protein